MLHWEKKVFMRAKYLHNRDHLTIPAVKKNRKYIKNFRTPLLQKCECHFSLTPPQVSSNPHHGHHAWCRIPCGTKFLREFNFADWRFFVFCGN